MQFLTKKKILNPNLIYATSSIIFLGTIFLADVYVARNFSLEKVGAWKQLILLVQFTAILLSFGIIEGFRYNIAKNNDFTHRYLGVATFFIVVIALIIWLILMFPNSRQFIASLLGVDIIAKVGFLIPLLYFFLSLNSLYQQICLAKNMIKVIFIAMMSFSAFFFVIFGILLSLSSLKFEIIIFSSFILSFIIQSIIYITYTKIMPFFSISDIRFFLTKILKFGFPLFIATYFGILTLHIDKIIINKLGGIEAFAIYSIGALEIPIIALIAKSFTSISYPKIVALVKENSVEEAKTLWINDLLKVSYITYPIICLFMVFSKSIIVGIFGSAYMSAVPIFKAYCLILLWRNTIYGTIMTVQENTYLIAKYSFIALLVNITFSLILFKVFGIIGVIYATFIAITALHLFFMFYEKTIKRFFKELTSNIYFIILLVSISVCYFVLGEY